MAREWRKVSREEAKAHSLYGVKNWLAFFALGVLLVPLREVGALIGEAESVGLTLAQLLDSNASFKTWVLLVLATEAAMVVTIFGLMLSKSPHFRVVASAILIAIFPAFALFAFFTEAPGGGVAIGMSFFPWVVSCLVWVTYLQRSRRVRVTFEHCVLATDSAANFSAAPVPSPTHVPVVEMPHIPTTTSSAPATSASQTVEASAQLAHAAFSSGPGPRATATGAGVAEEALWAQALDEFNGIGRKQGLWAKAFAQAAGNESAAQAQYLSERVRQLSEEYAADHRALAERLVERQRSEELARQVVAQRVSVVRTNFVAGKRLSPEDVTLLVKAVDTDPTLMSLSDRFRGETLLHLTARYGLRAEAITLIGKGANLDAPNGSGRRPYELAEDPQLRDILRSVASDSRL